MSEGILRYVDIPRLERPEAIATGDELDVLDQVNRRIAAAHSLVSTIDYLFEQLRPICACDRIGLAFIEEDGTRIKSFYAVADYEPLLLRRGYIEDLRGSSLKQVMERDQLRIIDDLEAYLAQHPGSASTHLIVKEGVRSSMTCPLSVDGRNVGLLFRSSRTQNAFTDRHAVLHQAIAERLSQAVAAAYRIEQLESAVNAYMEMLGFVSHELKSPVASMVTDADLLAGGYLGDLNDKQREKLKRLSAKGEYLLGLVREYIDLSRIEGGELQPGFESVDDLVKAVIEPTVDIVLPQLEAKHMTLLPEFPDAPLAAELDVNLIKIVMVNLLSNAVKYGDEGGKIELSLAGGGDGITISVLNEGPGFPEDQRQQLFKKFSRLKTKELMKRKGTGVGLYTSWKIVQVHGGRIQASSREGEWAKFEFTIPQPIPPRGG
ncbi:GAF domain-containing sensor histidine kinase [bacterium]|nr:GAF domain-containing sensor histidine kinase [candidate division CSSED10-310 bacterium]